MRPIKRSVITLILAVFICSLGMVSVAYAQTGTYVHDTMDLLPAEEFNKLESKGKEYAEKYNMGVYLLTTASMGSNEGEPSGRNEFARDYYEKQGLGVGKDKDGIILVVASNSRKYVIVNKISDKAKDPFSDDGVKSLESDVKSYLKNNNWADAAKAYYDDAGEQLEYFKSNGKQWKKPHYEYLLIKIAATILIPLMIAFAIVRSRISAMKTAQIQTNATSYESDNGLNLTVSNDNYLYRTTNVTPLPKNDKSSSDSGGWSDMGGGYSGSGGGDF